MHAFSESFPLVLLVLLLVAWGLAVAWRGHGPETATPRGSGR